MQLAVFRVEHARLRRGTWTLVVQIPCQHGLSGGVPQHPAVAGVHAMLEEQIAGDVVTRDSISRHCVARLVVGLGWRDVLHYQIAAGIAYPERFSFGVELCECEIFFVLPD